MMPPISLLDRSGASDDPETLAEEEELSMSAAQYAQNSASFGHKTIGLMGGIALLINNITGSGMASFPALFQRSGWLPVTACLILIMCLSIVCGVMLIEAMALVKGNHQFDKRIEYSSLAHHYCSFTAYALIQLFFQFSLMCNNLTSIIQSVQVMDWALVAIFGKTCALPEIYPNFSFWCAGAVADTGNTPFGDDVYVLSLGFILTVIVVIPLGLYNLDENIFIQKFAFMSVLFIIIGWVGLFSDLGLVASRVPSVTADQSLVLGTVIFNFAVITSIPSWINEKKPKVSVMWTLLLSMVAAVVMFIALGIFGGMAYAPWFNNPDTKNDTILDRLHDGSNAFGKFTYYFFPVVVNLTSIPVFAIMQRYNLLMNNVCGKFGANFLGVVLPWLLCLPFYTGKGFGLIVNWAGVLFNSVINFIVPPILYILAVKAAEHRAKHALLDHFHESSSSSSASLKDAVNSNGLHDGADLGLAAATVDEDYEAYHRWSIVPQKYHHLRIPFAYSIIGFMSILCIATIALNIYNDAS